jgi:phage tail-like protein
MADSPYQNVNFHFKVHFPLPDPKTGDKNGAAVDIRFQSVTGLDSTIDTETIKEGGENRFEHVIPTRRKYGPLVLKRGLLSPEDSGITKWLKDAFDNEVFTTLDGVVIVLLNEDHQPMLQWTVNNVWPRSWKIGELNAERGEILIETLELSYNRLLYGTPKEN